MGLQILLVRHGVTDENRAHSLGGKQEMDPVLSQHEIEKVTQSKGTRRWTIEPSGIEEAENCGDALVQYLFDGKHRSPEEQRDAHIYATRTEQLIARRHHRSPKNLRLLQPLGLQPKEVKILSSIFPRARDTANHILERMELAGFPLSQDQLSESANIVEIDMPFKRLGPHARISLRHYAKRYPETKDAENIKILFGKHPGPSVLSDCHPYAPELSEIQKNMCGDLEDFIGQCRRDEAKVGIIVAHAMTLQAVRGLLCGIDGKNLHHMRPQSNASVLAIDLPGGIGSGQMLGYVHGHPHQRNDSYAI